MNLTLPDVGVLALLLAGSQWLLAVAVKSRIELSLQSEIERLRSSLSVRAEFSKLVAQKRLDVLLALWPTALSVSTEVHTRWQGGEGLAAVLEHMNEVKRSEILFPAATIDEIHKFTTALIDVQTKLGRVGGQELLDALNGAQQAGENLRDYLRGVLETGFRDAARREA